MSLKNVGKIYEGFKKLDTLGTIKSIGNFDDAAKALKTFDKIDVDGKFNLLKQAFPEIADNAVDAALGINRAADAVDNLGGKGKNVGTLGNAFTGFGVGLKAFATSATGILSIAMAAGVAIVALEDLFTVDYDEANANLDESVSKYNETTDNLQSLNSELDTTKSRMDELQTLKDAGTITIAENVELENLQASNTELERKISLQEKLQAIQSRTAIDDAKESMEKETHNVAQSVKMGDSKGEQSFKGNVGKVTDIDAVKEDVKEINEYNKALPGLEENIVNIQKKIQKYDELGEEGIFKKFGAEIELNNAEKELKRYQDSIKTLYSDLDTRTSKMQTQLDIFKLDPTVYKKEINALEDAINSIGNTNIDLSPAEQQLKSIDTFFGKSSSKGLKEHFRELAESGKLTTDSFSKLGFDASTFGAKDLEQVSQYFKDITKSATDAANAVNKIDGSVDGISNAMESDNAGDNFVKMKEYLDKSQELLAQGLTGADDFKTVEMAITQGTGKSYQEAYDQLQNYFTTDQNEDSPYFGQLTRDGIQNFSNDFLNLGKNFKTTGEAAKEMGISTQMFETLMERVSDYDGLENVEQSFAGMVKTSEQLSDARSDLEGIKSIYEKLDESDPTKAQLKADIDGWESQIATAENDLSSLPEEVVTKLKFEYDRLELEQINADTRERIGAGVSNDEQLSLQANIIVNNAEIIDGLIEEKQINIETNVEVSNALNKIDTLKEKISNETNEQKKIDIQVDIDQAQQDLINLLQGRTVKVDATANVSKVEDNTGGTEVNATANVTEATDNTGGTTVDATANVNNTTLSGLPVIDVPATATVQSVKPLPTPLNIAMGELQANVNYQKGEQAPPEDKNAVANYELGTSPITIPDASGLANFTLGYYPMSLPGITQTVTRNYIDGTKASGTMLSPAHASGTAYNMLNLKSAYANGNVSLDKNENSLVNELGTESIIRDGIWSLIPGKMHMENLKKGDIVLSAKQTSDLLNTGKTNSHARAFANGTMGTAYASGGIVGNITNLNRPSSKKNKDNEDNSFSEIFDHIEIWLNRLDRTLENLKDSIGDYTEDLSKQNAIAQDAINQTKGSLSTLQSAYETYMAQANAVGLEDNWKGVVDSGEIRISEITDEDLKQRIEDYQKYLEDANNISDKIAEYQRDLLDLAQEKLSNIENYYQNRSDYNEDFGYSTDIDELKKALKEYQNELGNQMDSGVIKQGSDAWFQAQKTIAEYLSNILEATWNKLEYVIDGLDRVSDKLDNVSSLEEAKGNKLTEKDYQTQIDTNNKSIQAQYNLRDSYKDQMAIYDVDSKQYQDLAEKIAQCDDEIFKLREDNEDLKDSIWDVRFTQPLDKLKNKYSDVIEEADKFRDLMDSDSFVAKDGSLTSNGLANIAMIMQGMNASKQITADYTASLKKLDEALKNNIISQSEYDEQQKDILDTINDSVGTTEDYKNSLVDIYKEMAQAEVDSQNKMIDKQKEYMSTQKEAHEYSKKIQSQSKSANQLRSQIAALEGVSNQSAQLELKRLKQELAEQEDEIAETKKDHEYTVRIEGLDSVSDSLTEALDTTLDEITYNAEKQESIVKEMLEHVVNAYGTAYDKINSIIKDTGFQFGYDNNNNIGNIGNGAQDQYNQATTPQPNVKPSDTVTDIDTGAVNNTPNIDNIITDISKPIDTTNRKVAELKLNRESMSIQEGSSGSLSVNIRPTDAKNKAVIWTSSNPAVATVSGGSVNAKKTGSTTITVATTDGSGLSASCGVNVAEKPKPPTPPSSGSGGDGNPRVGDVCTLNGSYFYDSWGTSPAGNRYSGVSGGIVIDGYSSSKYGGGASYTGGYDVHIKSADGRYGDLGWVRLDQLSGYASGTRSATAGLHQVDELGNELKLKTIEHNGKKYTMFDSGDQVFKANMSSNLFDIGNNPTAFISNHMPTIPDFSGSLGGGDINVHYDKLIEIQGNVDKDALPELKEIISQAVSATKAEILKSYNKHN